MQMATNDKKSWIFEKAQDWTIDLLIVIEDFIDMISDFTLC